MNESTKRALRTAFHVLVAIATAIPTILSNAPAGVVLGQVVVVAAVVSKIVNQLEDNGLLPGWLSVGAAPAVVTKDIAAVEALAPEVPKVVAEVTTEIKAVEGDAAK